MARGCFIPLRFNSRSSIDEQEKKLAAIARGPDDDRPELGLQFAEFGGGCFWGLELALQRVPGVIKTEAGYSQGTYHRPSYRDVCDGFTGHAEVVRVVYDANVCPYEALLDAFWRSHDPTTANRQGHDVGTQYRSGVYVYDCEQEKIARASIERLERRASLRITTEVLPARKFYKAEAFHQQYLSKGGRFGFKQSAAKGCTDRIRPYG